MQDTTWADDATTPVTEVARTTRTSGQFWIWAGANIAPINWVLGALGISMGLGLRDTLTVLILGNLIGMTVFGFFTLLGQRTGLSAMVMGRGVFGRKGNYVPTLVQLAVVVGWCAVNTWIILDLVMALLGKLDVVDPIAANHGAKVLVAAVIMAVQVLISFFGYKVISTFERWTVPPTLLVLLAMSVVAWGTMHIDWGYAGPVTGALTGADRIVAMSQVMTAIGIGWGLTWLTYAGDYSRFISARVPQRRLWLASAAGQIIPVIWLGVLGATLATKSGSVDPGQMIVDNYGALAIPVLLLVIHGPIATNILNVYSFSVTAQALDIRIARRTLSVIVGVLAMVAVVAFIYSSGIAETLDAWLSGVVGWTATWGGVVMVHHYVLDKERTDFSALCDGPDTDRVAAVSWRALLAFGLGVLATWMCMYGMVPALQGPVASALHGLDLSWLAGMIVASGSYYLLMRGRRLPLDVLAPAAERARAEAPVLVGDPA